MGLREVVEVMLPVAGPKSADVDDLLLDEHLRYRFYLDALAQADSVAEAEFISLVLADPDKVMAEAAVVNQVDRRAAEFDSAASFTAWVTQILDRAAGFPFLERRVREWEIYRRLSDGDTVGVDVLRDSSDWLQRKLAVDATSNAVLRSLAEFGRTKRVRNVARSRVRDDG